MDKTIFKVVKGLRKKGCTWRGIARTYDMDHVTLWHQYYRYKASLPFYRRFG